MFANYFSKLLYQLQNLNAFALFLLLIGLPSTLEASTLEASILEASILEASTLEADTVIGMKTETEKKPHAPILIIQLQSLQETFDRLQKFARHFPKHHFFREGIEFLQDCFINNSLEGIDTTRNLALVVPYNKTQALVPYFYLPLKDAEKAKKFLSRFFFFNWKYLTKEKIYEVQYGKNALPIYAKFEDDLAIFCLLNSSSLLGDIPPYPSLKKIDPLINVHLSIQSMPKVILKLLLGTLEKSLLDSEKKSAYNNLSSFKEKPKNRPITIEKNYRSSSNSLLENLHQLIEDGEEIHLSFDLDPKKENIFFSFDLICKKGSYLQKKISENGSYANRHQHLKHHEGGIQLFFCLPTTVMAKNWLTRLLQQQTSSKSLSKNLDSKSTPSNPQDKMDTYPILYPLVEQLLSEKYVSADFHFFPKSAKNANSFWLLLPFPSPTQKTTTLFEEFRNRLLQIPQKYLKSIKESKEQISFQVHSNAIPYLKWFAISKRDWFLDLDSSGLSLRNSSEFPLEISKSNTDPVIAFFEGKPRDLFGILGFRLVCPQTDPDRNSTPIPQKKEDPVILKVVASDKLSLKLRIPFFPILCFLDDQDDED